MKKLIKIPTVCNFCKICFNEREANSSYCGKSNCKKRKNIYFDKQEKFPLIKEAKNKFPINYKTIFTYDDTIYCNEYNKDFPFHLLRHEIEHIIQQKAVGVKKWWEKYFNDNKFRLKQEAKAYHEQYKVAKNRNYEKAEFLVIDMAKSLSSQLYGNIISFEKAVEMIKKIDY